MANTNTWIGRLTDHPLLTREAEYELATRAVAGDVEARRELVRCNMRLVVSYALVASRKVGVVVDDLIGEGVLAMYEDVFRKFDPERGYRFSTYANHWLKNRLLEMALSMAATVEGNRGAKEHFNRLNKLRHELGKEASDLTDEDLAERLGWTEATLKRAHASRTSDLSIYNVLSSEDGQTTFADTMTAEDADETDQSTLVARRDLIAKIRRQIDALISESDPRECYIIEHRLVTDERETLAEIGERFNVSREYIRQLEAGLKKRLRCLLAGLR